MRPWIAPSGRGRRSRDGARHRRLGHRPKRGRLTGSAERFPPAWPEVECRHNRVERDSCARHAKDPILVLVIGAGPKSKACTPTGYNQAPPGATLRAAREFQRKSRGTSNESPPATKNENAELTKADSAFCVCSRRLIVREPSADRDYSGEAARAPSSRAFKQEVEQAALEVGPD
jgi:hypothetical protein